MGSHAHSSSVTKIIFHLCLGIMLQIISLFYLHYSLSHGVLGNVVLELGFFLYEQADAHEGFFMANLLPKSYYY
jgi:hypothetical protein